MIKPPAPADHRSLSVTDEPSWIVTAMSGQAVPTAIDFLTLHHQIQSPRARDSPGTSRGGADERGAACAAGGG